MGDDNNSVFDILNQLNDARQTEQMEREIRYTSRKNAKGKNRQNIEQTAEKLCAAITHELEKEHTPNDLAALATALSGAATALQMAENYAESMPIYGSGIGCCAV